MEPDLFWFPWCTSAYIPEYVAKKVPELEASSEFWGVRSSCGHIYVQVARNPFGVGYLTKREWQAKGELKC